MIGDLGTGMKTKKAVKKLDKIKVTLTTIIEGLSKKSDHGGIEKLLGSAKTAVVRARKAVISASSSKPPRKPVRSETARTRRRDTASGKA